MGTKVVFIGVAAPIPKKAGERVERAGHQCGAENIKGFRCGHLLIWSWLKVR
jgi:hypothetical protein